MKWIEYKIYTTTEDADYIGEILLECGIEGFEISDHVPLSAEDEKAMFTDIPADLGEDDGSSVLTFYTETPETAGREHFSTGSSLRDQEIEKKSIPEVLQPEEWILHVREVLKQWQENCTVSTPHITYSVQDDSRWKDKWKENFKAFYAAENVFIRPSWEKTPETVKKDDIVIEIDPGQAFGSGTHETTKLCLMALKKYITPDTTILDSGCGSGILAIASLLCGAKSVFGCDIDPLAVTATLENAERNHIAHERLRVIQADILKDEKRIQWEHPEKFHILVANILADVILSLAEVAAEFITENGYFISSGILADRADEVERELRRNHFQILEKNCMGEWCAFVCQRTDKREPV